MTDQRKIKTSDVRPQYEISRRVLLQDDFNEISEFKEKNVKVLDQLKKKIFQFRCISCLISVIPVLKWLPKYPFKSNIIGDLTGGITVSIMQIPQGMGFALLAGVSPSVGLYMAFFHSLTYFVFGTSRHNSVGTSSIVSVMSLQFVYEYGSDYKSSSGEMVEALYTPIQVVMALSVACGLQMLLMAIFQLGIVATLLSESLISGFMTGAAIHVVASQFKDIFGIQIDRLTGVFKVGKTVYAIGSKIMQTNITTLIIFVVVIIFLIVMNDLVKPRLAKLCRFPLPAELIAVACGTLASVFLNLGSSYGVHLVGEIPLGLPSPAVPPIELIGKVALGALPISIVSYSISISMALVMSVKKKYNVRANQEMVALAACHLVGSLFSCVPVGTSFARSLVQEHTGGNTQVASVVSAGIVLLVLLYIGALFVALPRCVLAGIIIVALKGILMNVGIVRQFHRESVFNSLTWLVTFFGVVLLDVDIGLFIGVGFSLITLYFKGFRAVHCELGSIPGTNLYADLSTHHQALANSKIRIYRHIGPINFAFGNSFKSALYDCLDITHKTIRQATETQSGKTTDGIELAEPRDFNGMRCLIIDLSGVSHVDVAGVKTIAGIQKDMQLLGVELILSGPNDNVFAVFQHSEIDIKVGNFLVFPSVHDAVLMAKTLF